MDSDKHRIVLLCDEKNSIWLPEEANDLQLKLCIVAHTLIIYLELAIKY